MPAIPFQLSTNLDAIRGLASITVFFAHTALWFVGPAPQAFEFFKDRYKRVIHTNREPLKAVARSINESLTIVFSYSLMGLPMLSQKVSTARPWLSNEE